MKNNTTQLLNVGYLSVFTPTILALFGPPVLVFIPMTATNEIDFVRIAIALIIGLVLSFLVYKSTLRWWVNWAFNKATHPSELKRKSLDARLITREGEALLGNGFFLPINDLAALDQIDENEVEEDDMKVPPFIEFKPYEVAGYSVILLILAFFVLLFNLWISERLPNFSYSYQLGFWGFIIFIFLYKRLNKTVTKLYMDEKGILLGEELIPWKQVQDFDIHQNPNGNNRIRLNFRLINGTMRSFYLPRNTGYLKGSLRQAILIYQFRNKKLQSI